MSRANPVGWRTGVRRLYDLLTWVPAALGTVAVIAMVLNVTIDVAMRALFGKPLNGTLDYVSFWYLPVMVFGGLALAQRRREHISVGEFLDWLPPSAARYVGLFADLISTAFLLAIVYYSWRAALRHMADGESSVTTGAPLWPVRFIVPVGVFAYAVHLAVDAVTIRDRRSSAELAEPHEGTLQ